MRTAARREPIEVAEPRRSDPTLGLLIGVRRQRLERQLQECGSARQQWRALRRQLRTHKLAWRDQLAAARHHWQRSRDGYFALTLSHQEFQTAKAVYERLKQAAAVTLHTWRAAAAASRQAGAAYFSARARARQAQLQQEKLTLLRAELAAQRPPEE